MTSEYNSMLITKLYSTINEDEMVELLEEIEEIGDPIFLYPVYEAYKKNKNNSISLYFILTMNNLNSDEVIQVAMEIGENPESKNVDRLYVLKIFDKRKYYEQRALNIALKSLSIFITEIGDELDLYRIVPFIENVDMLNTIQSELFSIFENDNFNTKSREYAFGKWLVIDPKEKLQHIIDNFSEIKQNSAKESIIARIIIGWKGSIIEELKLLIEKEGGAKAKHIVARSREKEEKNEQIASEKKQQNVQKQYSNADLVEKICTLREKINDVTKSNQDFGFSLFPPNEAMFSQLKTANDNASLMKACVGLREIIQNLNNELANHGLIPEEIKSILPNTAEEDINKSLNKLFLYFHSKKYKINNDIFGLKLLNQLVGLLGAHPQSEKEKLIKKLTALNLYKAFQEEEWATIHQSLLEQYDKSLNLLFDAVKLKKSEE